MIPSVLPVCPRWWWTCNFRRLGGGNIANTSNVCPNDCERLLITTVAVRARKKVQYPRQSPGLQQSISTDTPTEKLQMHTLRRVPWRGCCGHPTNSGSVSFHLKAAGGACAVSCLTAGQTLIFCSAHLKSSPAQQRRLPSWVSYPPFASRLRLAIPRRRD